MKDKILNIVNLFAGLMYYLYGWIILDMLPAPSAYYELTITQNDIVSIFTWIFISWVSATILSSGVDLFTKEGKYDGN